MGMRRVILHDNTMAASNGTPTSAPGIGSATGGEHEHSITVTITGTGALSVVVDPQWTNDAGAANTAWASVNGTRTLTGTDSATAQYVFHGAAQNVRLVTSSLSGTGLTVHAVWCGA